jgi:hypothetical protein
MKAYSANATFISNIYTQEVGDTNWNEYQVVVTGGSNSLNIRTADTTANSLSAINEIRVSSNDTLLLSIDGSNVVSGTCGLVTNGTIKTQTSTPTIVASKSSNTSPLTTLYTTNTPYSPRGYKLKPDGKIFWAVKSDGTLLEFSIGTVGNMNTATTTGKTLTNCQGIDFSIDGKYLFRMSNTSNYTIERLTLSTPWDISTVITSATISKAVSGLPNTTIYNWLKVQQDGLGVLVAYNGSIYRCAIPTAYDITSMSTSYDYTIAIPNSSYIVDCSVDGKAWYWTTHSATNTVNAYAAVAGTAYDPRTLGTAITLTCTDTTYVYSYTSSYTMAPLINLDGSLTLLPMQYSSGTAYNRHATFNVDIGLTKNIDISAFGLSSAPAYAWLKMPTVSIATGRLASTIGNWTSVILELDGNVNGYTSGIAATTTTAVVGIDGSGILATGDSVLLNGTTTVSLTNVVETSSGLVKQDPSNAIDYIKYNSKTYSTGTGTAATAASGSSTAAFGQQKVRFSNDGNYMYIYGGETSFKGVGVYQYTLSTPWDVTTSTFNAFRAFAGNYSYASGFDINPDGSSLVIANGSIYGAFYLYQYTMSKNHDITTAVLATTLTNLTPFQSGYAACYITNIRFNRTGTQLEVYEGYLTAQYHWYYTIGTAYTLSTLNSANLYTTGYATNYTPQSDGCFSPDGNTYFSLGYAAPNATLDCYLFSQSVATSNSFTGFTWTAKSTAADTSYTNWPAGSITNTAYGRSIDISPDGTKLYVLLATGTVYQFSVRVKTLNKYALTFATQGSAPTSVAIPAAIATPTMTTSVVSGNIVQTSNSITTNARAMQFKLTNNPAFSEITKVQLNLRKSA